MAKVPSTCHLTPLTICLLENPSAKKWAIRLTGLNLSNHRYLLDNSNTFGGTHFVNPREISVQLKYKFRY